MDANVANEEARAEVSIGRDLLIGTAVGAIIWCSFLLLLVDSADIGEETLIGHVLRHAGLETRPESGLLAAAFAV